MASVLVDLDDISYIDDITDDDVIHAEEDNYPKAGKRKKGRGLIGEELKINPNDKLVMELRQERKENKTVLDSIDEDRDQTNRDLAKLQDLITDQVKQKIIQDLREERAKFNSDLQAERLEEQGNDSCQVCSDDKLHCYQPKLNMTKEIKDKMNKGTENEDKMRMDSKNSKSGGENSESFVKTKTYANIEKNTLLENTADFQYKQDAHTEGRGDSEETNFDFTEKTVLVKTDSKADSKSKSKRQKYSDEGKENIEDDMLDETEDNHMQTNNENEKDTTHLLNSGNSNSNSFTDITDKETSEYNGAKPKLFTRRVNGHDMQLKELNLELFPNSETSKNSAKGKSSKKKKSKALLEAPEQYLQSSGSDIKILVTDAEGTEMVAHMSGSTTETSRNTWNSNFSSPSSPSNATSTPHSRKSSALNYLRKMSEDQEGTKNNLLEQAALYKQQKAKPFQKLARIKYGFLSAGIEGDSKRSYIKALAIMPDKKLIMFDRKNKCLKLFDQDCNPLDRVSLTTKYCGLTVIFDETFAATLPSLKKLQLYHIDNDTNRIRQERTHPVEGEFYSITYHRHRLYLIQRIRTQHFTENDDWEIKKVNINKNTEEMKTIRKFSPGHKDFNLLANDQGLYMTNRLENEVLMLRHDGSILHRHKVEFSLPVGITTDRFGNIYVCGGSVTSFIEVIKPDLQRYRIIYKKTSSNPVALCFDQDDSILYISDQILGKIIKYKIQHNGTVHGLMRAMLINSPSQISK